MDGSIVRIIHSDVPFLCDSKIFTYKFLISSNVQDQLSKHFSTYLKNCGSGNCEKIIKKLNFFKNKYFYLANIKEMPNHKNLQSNSFSYNYQDIIIKHFSNLLA